jgi:hypothetical protein
MYNPSFWGYAMSVVKGFPTFWQQSSCHLQGEWGGGIREALKDLAVGDN